MEGLQKGVNNQFGFLINFFIKKMGNLFKKFIQTQQNFWILKLPTIFCIIPLILLIIQPQILSQNNPACKAKQYQCKPANITMNEAYCVFINDTQEKINYQQKCSNSTDICPYSGAGYGNPVSCQADTTVELNLPGESCATDGDCYSAACDLEVTPTACEGKNEGFSCNTHHDCKSTFYCNSATNLCELQRQFDQVSFSIFFKKSHV